MTDRPDGDDALPAGAGPPDVFARLIASACCGQTAASIDLRKRWQALVARDAPEARMVAENLAQIVARDGFVSAETVLNLLHEALGGGSAAGPGDATDRADD